MGVERHVNFHALTFGIFSLRRDDPCPVGASSWSVRHAVMKCHRGGRAGLYDGFSRRVSCVPNVYRAPVAEAAVDLASRLFLDPRPRRAGYRMTASDWRGWQPVRAGPSPGAPQALRP